MKLLRLEFFKLKRKRLFLTIPLFLSAELLWAFMATSVNISKHPDSAIWESIFTTISAMNGLLLPILAAIVVSRICDMEHKGNTWWLLVSNNISKSKVYFYKFLTANLIMLYVSILQAIAIMVFGVLHKFNQPLPLLLLTKLILATSVTNLVVISLQQFASMLIKNQSFALCLGMVGGFIGMTSALFPTVIRRIFIWSYYNDLAPVTLQFKNDKVNYLYNNNMLVLGTVILVVALVFYLIGKQAMVKKDI